MQKTCDTIIVTALISGMFFLHPSSVTEATAQQVRCRTDWTGDYVCTYPNGQEVRCRTDWTGDYVCTYPNGQQTRCRTDWTGEYVCQ